MLFDYILLRETHKCNILKLKPISVLFRRFNRYEHNSILINHSLLLLFLQMLPEIRQNEPILFQIFVMIVLRMIDALV